jgi:deoxyhypusine synthase
MNVIEGTVEDLGLESNVKALLKGMAKTAFNARRLGEALDILEKMTTTCDLRVITVAGAVVPAGLRGLLREALTRRLFNVVVSTGANITHDLLMAFGGRHYRLKLSDVEDEGALRAEGFCRIYDVAVRVEDFAVMEKGLREILEGLEDKTYSTREILREIGLRIRDEGSFVRAAAMSSRDVVVPAFYDSILGVQVWSLTQTRRLRVLEALDLSYLVDLQFDVKRRGGRTGILIVGGGSPKNFALQSALIAGKPFDYAVQITVDSPYYGGLSGATLREAVSWEKVLEKGEHCTVYCDFTVVLPLLLSALMC